MGAAEGRGVRGGFREQFFAGQRVCSQWSGVCRQPLLGSEAWLVNASRSSRAGGHSLACHRIVALASTLTILGAQLYPQYLDRLLYLYIYTVLYLYIYTVT